MYAFFVSFTDPATTEIYTLSLHDALPIFLPGYNVRPIEMSGAIGVEQLKKLPGMTATRRKNWTLDRKSTRLNSSHANISYAVFCLKKKIKGARTTLRRCGRQAETP